MGSRTQKLFLLSIGRVWVTSASHLLDWKFIPCFPVSSIDVQEQGVHNTCICPHATWTGLLDLLITANAHLVFRVSSQKGRWQNPSETLTGKDVLCCFMQFSERWTVSRSLWHVLSAEQILLTSTTSDLCPSEWARVQYLYLHGAVSHPVLQTFLLVVVQEAFTVTWILYALVWPEAVWFILTDI